jgi:hypothetical protein
MDGSSEIGTVDRGERWAPASGLAFVVAFVALYFLFFVPVEVATQDANATQIADYYRESGAAGLLLTYSLVGLAGAALLWFAGSLWASLRRLEPDPGRLSAIAFGGGVASAMLLFAGEATLLAPFTVVAIESEVAFDPTLHGVLSAMGFTAINFALLASAVMVVATSLVAMRRDAFPTWFTWVGFIVALALALNSLYFFGLFVWIGWVLLASVLLLTRGAHVRRLTPRWEDSPSEGERPRP